MLYVPNNLVAPSTIILRFKSPAFAVNLTTVTAISAEVQRRDGSTTTFVFDIVSATQNELVAEYAFTDGSEFTSTGVYYLIPTLTVPGGTISTASVAMFVTEPFSFQPRLEDDSWVLTTVPVEGPATAPGIEGFQFVYQEGGTASGNVYTTFAAAYAVAILTDSLCTIQIDSTYGTPEVTAGTYDLRRIKLVGAPYKSTGASIQLFFRDGAVVTGWYTFDGLRFISTSSSAITTATPGNVLVIASFETYISSVSAPFFRINNGAYIYLGVWRTGGILNDTPSVQIDAGGIFIALIDGAAWFQADVLTGGGYAYITLLSAAAVVGSQPSLSLPGALTIAKSALAENVAVADAGNYYTGTKTVETVLQQVGAALAETPSGAGGIQEISIEFDWQADAEAFANAGFEGVLKNIGGTLPAGARFLAGRIELPEQFIVGSYPGGNDGTAWLRIMTDGNYDATTVQSRSPDAQLAYPRANDTQEIYPIPFTFGLWTGTAVGVVTPNGIDLGGKQISALMYDDGGGSFQNMSAGHVKIIVWYFVPAAGAP